MRVAEKRSPVQLEPSHPRPMSSSRLSGYLRVTAVPDSSGKTILVRKEYRTPIHISKPYWDGNSLLLNVMSPTAGLLEGDQVDLDVVVETGAKLVLSNPTALRVHKMDTGKATWTQRIRVVDDAFLECHPEWIILQANSRFEQRSRIELNSRAQLFFIEAIAPGRVASGESFAFTSFRNRFELLWDGKLSALERSDIRPKRATHTGWKTAFESPFYLSIYIAAPELERADPFFQFIHELQTPTLLCGASKLSHGPCWNIKLLAQSSVEAKAALHALRERFYQSIGRNPVNLRR